MINLRTNEFINWKRFVESESNKVSFILDFHIDAGFSFTQAIVFRKMEKTGKSVTIDRFLNVPKLTLNFDKLIVNDNLIIHLVELKSIYSSSTYDVEDEYLVSIHFSLKKIDFGKIKEEFKSNKKDEVDTDTKLRVIGVNYFQNISEIIVSKFTEFVSLSGFFVKYKNSSLNLYSLEKGEVFRVFQLGGGVETSGHNPIHPFHIKSKAIEERYKNFSILPDNIKALYSKGIQYKFMGFFDESFLCFYKIIEIVFKGKDFSKGLADEFFDVQTKKVGDALKSSNQKVMMLFIYKKISTRLKSSDVRNNEFSEINFDDVMEKLLECSDLRNEIAHRADCTVTSKELLGFVMWVANFMIECLLEKRTN